MSKAEERATKLIIPKQVDNVDELCRFFYIKGYHQAEQDLELTWEDVEYIIETYHRVEYSREFISESYNNVCKEVLKRFKESKNVKQKI